MKRKFIICIIIVALIVILCLTFLIILYRSPNKTKDLNNIALCYHGITDIKSEKSQYVTYLDDFKGQINHLKSKGYTFVLPSQYNKWYTNKYKPNTPIATIMFDDARTSVSLASNWLIKENIPFGITIIGRRLRSLEAEEGYMNWSTIKTIMDKGNCELLNHSYNLHHYGLFLDNTNVVSSPLLEGPCYLDTGEFIYIDSEDPRWYWDMSLIDDISWAFPLLGTDTTTGKPITSTIEFKARENVTATKLRVWACLHSPASGGYNAKVRVAINGFEVANNTINVTEYKNNLQWTEREFITIDFDKSYSIEANKKYTITLTTENTGNSILMIYSIPDFSGNYQLSTTCKGMTYETLEKWPARACVIITGDDGKQVSDLDFTDYVTKDLIMNNKVINDYLSATWTEHTTGYTENNNLECITLGGTYSDGSSGNTSINFIPDMSFTGQVLRLKNATHLGKWYPLIIDIYINDMKIARYSPNWKDNSWQLVNITPYKFMKGKEYKITFKTINKSTHGTGLIRILADQQDLPWPKWNKKTESWIKPSKLQFQHELGFEVSSLEGSDVYPDDICIKNLDYKWKYKVPFDGPGKPFLEFLSYKPGTSTVTNQICYPFGSYYSQNSNGMEDINPILKNVFETISIETGYAIWGDGITSMDMVQSKYSKYIIPRYMIDGNMKQSQILENIDVLIENK